ncbi:lytic transglycosylase domain-containing protein [Catalinimonas alkaloidigena]|nr:lytic transglycosylase domain-containing protein [Catalinimonas alkaloidigena]
MAGYLSYNQLSAHEAPNAPVPQLAFDAEEPMRYQYQVNPVEVPVKNVKFASETVPMRQRDLQERFDRELLSYTYWHSHSMIMMKRANRWFPQITPILRQYGLPEDLKYVVAVESNFENVVSPVGAVGFWQLMEETAKELGLEVNNEVDERYHPLKATDAAARYFLFLRNYFGSYANALAAYNAGMGRIERAMASQKQDSYYNLLLNEETSRYMFRIMAAKEIIQHPKKYGFNMAKSDLYQQEPVRKVTVDSTIADLTTWAIDQGINYKLLKLYNPWLRANTLTVKEEGKSYVIDIPLHPELEEEEELTDSIMVEVDSVELAPPTDSALNPDSTQEEDGLAFMSEGPGKGTSASSKANEEVEPETTTPSDSINTPTVPVKKVNTDEKPKRKKVQVHYKIRWYDTMARLENQSEAIAPVRSWETSHRAS